MPSSQPPSRNQDNPSDPDSNNAADDESFFIGDGSASISVASEATGQETSQAGGTHNQARDDISFLSSNIQPTRMSLSTQRGVGVASSSVWDPSQQQQQQNNNTSSSTKMANMNRNAWRRRNPYGMPGGQQQQQGMASPSMAYVPSSGNTSSSSSYDYFASQGQQQQEMNADQQTSRASQVLPSSQDQPYKSNFGNLSSSSMNRMSPYQSSQAGDPEPSRVVSFDGRFNPYNYVDYTRFGSNNEASRRHAALSSMNRTTGGFSGRTAAVVRIPSLSQESKDVDGSDSDPATAVSSKWLRIPDWVTQLIEKTIVPMYHIFEILLFGDNVTDETKQVSKAKLRIRALLRTLLFLSILSSAYLPTLWEMIMEPPEWHWPEGRSLGDRRCVMNLFIEKQSKDEFQFDFIMPYDIPKAWKADPANAGKEFPQPSPPRINGTYRTKMQLHVLDRFVEAIADSFRSNITIHQHLVFANTRDGGHMAELALRHWPPRGKSLAQVHIIAADDTPYDEDDWELDDTDFHPVHGKPHRFLIQGIDMVGVKDHPEGLDINDPLNYGQLHRIEMGLEGHVRRDQFHLYDRNGIAGTVKPKEDDYYFDDLNIDDDDDEVDDDRAQELSETVPLIPGKDPFNSTGWDTTPRFNTDDDRLLEIEGKWLVPLTEEDNGNPFQHHIKGGQYLPPLEALLEQDRKRAVLLVEQKKQEARLKEAMAAFEIEWDKKKAAEKAEEEAEKAKEGKVEDGEGGRRLQVLEGNETQPTPPPQNHLENFLSQTKEEFEPKARLPYPNLSAFLPPDDEKAIIPFMLIDGLRFRDQMEVLEAAKQLFLENRVVGVALEYSPDLDEHLVVEWFNSVKYKTFMMAKRQIHRIDHLCPEIFEATFNHPYIRKYPDESSFARRKKHFLNSIRDTFHDTITTISHVFSSTEETRRAFAYKKKKRLQKKRKPDKLQPAYFAALPRGRVMREEMTIQHCYDLFHGVSGGGGQIKTANDRKMPGK